MDAKLKAKELVEKFWHKISGVPETCGVDLLSSEDTYVKLAKQCALIAVEIRLEHTFWMDKEYAQENNESVEQTEYFWQEVKKEINNTINTN